MKYVLFEDPSGLQYPIVFPELVQHYIIVNSVRAAYPGVKPVSAGFCSTSGNAWGESISCKIKSNPKNDEWYLKKMFGVDV